MCASLFSYFGLLVLLYHEFYTNIKFRGKLDFLNIVHFYILKLQKVPCSWVSACPQCICRLPKKQGYNAQSEGFMDLKIPLSS